MAAAAAAGSSSSKVAVVTGANQGIGYGICRRLAIHWSGFHFGSSSTPLTLYFTSRNVERGQKALEELKEELAKSGKVLAADGGFTTLKYHQLDITDGASRAKLLETLKKDEGGLDLLINNAGIALEGFDAQVVKDTLATNYWATKDIIEEYLPSIRPGGRVVTLASMAGKLNAYSPELQQRFLDVKATSESDALMKEFTAAVADGSYKEKGWPSSAYKGSKAGIIAAHRALAASEGKKDVLINSCCPGYVSSRMTKSRGHLTLDEGAATPVTLALDDIKGKSGTFWERQAESQW